MKKYIVLSISFLAIIWLTSCSPTPEELYMQELEVKIPKVEAIATTMEQIWTHIEKEDFIEVSKWLAVLKTETDAITIAPYAGEDTDLKEVSSELDIALDTVSQFASTLQPLSDKAATAPNSAMTPEDEASQNKAFELITQIETHFEAASAAFDQFEAKNQ